MQAIDKAGNITSATNNGITVVYENPASEIMTANQTIDGQLKGTYQNPIIPQGFKAIDNGKAIWKTEEEQENGWNEGLVIEDATGNQFVWVPVNAEINEDIQYKLDNNLELTMEEIELVIRRKAWSTNQASSTETSLVAAYTEPYANGYEEEQEEYIKMITSVLKTVDSM